LYELKEISFDPTQAKNLSQIKRSSSSKGGWSTMKVEMVLDEKEEKGKGANTYAPKSQIATNKFMREQIQFFKISFIDVVIYFDIIVVG
jgi:hypothetical protein